MTPLARNMALTLLVLFVVGSAATRYLGSRAQVPEASDQVREGATAMMAEDVQELGGGMSPFGLSVEDAAARARRGLKVVAEANGIPLVAVPNHAGVGLDRMGIRGWLMTYGKELPRGEAHHRLGLLYEFGLHGAAHDAAAALWWYEMAERDTHGEAHQRAASLRAQGVQPRPNRD